jgi:predicted lipoprotein with Yx(FWY)xxD motif
MTRIRLILPTLAALSFAALVVAGCGGSSKSSAPPTNPSGKPATVGVASTGLGNVLVDTQGRTLYLFEQDKGATSTCTGSCAANWPPLQATGKPSVGSGARPSLLGTSRRSDGKLQVTYDGHPLYLFAQDSSAGQTNGQGVNAFGAFWYVLSPAGTAITTAPQNSNGGGNGY